MIKVGFLGFDSTDIVVYLARILLACEKKVAVVDSTKRSVLLQMTQLPSAMEKGGYYHDVLFIPESMSEGELRSEEYDYVLHYFGDDMENPKTKDCDEVFLVTDMVPCNAEFLKSASLQEGVQKRFLVRNAISTKFADRYLAELTCLEIEKQNIYNIAYDEEDYRSKCYLCTETRKNIKIKNLSVGMKEFLRDVVANWMPDVSLKQLTKMMYRA